MDFYCSFIDFGLDFCIIFNVFLMHFPSARPPCKTSIFDDPYNRFACFGTLENRISHVFPFLFPTPFFALIYYGFWYRFALHFATLLGMIWNEIICCFGYVFCFFDSWWILNPKLVQEASQESSKIHPFRNLRRDFAEHRLWDAFL